MYMCPENVVWEPYFRSTPRVGAMVHYNSREQYKVVIHGPRRTQEFKQPGPQGIIYKLTHTYQENHTI